MSVGLIELNRVAYEVCYNATEWIAVSQEFHNTAMQFGYFCLIVGGIVGALVGYYYAKRKYGCSE